MTELDMNGSMRDWMFYLRLRRHKDTQKEHRELADMIYEVIRPKFPYLDLIEEN